MEIVEIPGKIRDLRIKKIALEKQTALDKQGIAVLEANISIDVSAEVNEAGKSKYSNETTRKAEITQRLLSNESYIALQEGLKKTNYSIRLIDAELEYEYNMLKLHLTQSCPFNK